MIFVFLLSRLAAVIEDMAFTWTPSLSCCSAAEHVQLEEISAVFSLFDTVGFLDSSKTLKPPEVISVFCNSSLSATLPQLTASVVLNWLTLSLCLSPSASSCILLLFFNSLTCKNKKKKTLKCFHMTDLKLCAVSQTLLSDGQMMVTVIFSPLAVDCSNDELHFPPRKTLFLYAILWNEGNCHFLICIWCILWLHMEISNIKIKIVHI